MIPLNHLDFMPKCLKEFLSDPKTCFVGVNVSLGLHVLKCNFDIEGVSGIRHGSEGVGCQDSKLKRPDLGGGWAQLAAAVGVSLSLIKESSSSIG